MKWMLILLSVNGQGDVSQEGVGPFETEELCRAAGVAVHGRINWKALKILHTFECVQSEDDAR